MISSPLRRVRTLRIRSASDDLNRRTAILIEDALRTASIPGGDGARVLIVRTLSLGRLHAHDASAAIALRIEERCRALSLAAVHALSFESADAPAVYFDDDGEACASLALRIACHLPVAEWFWPLAVRGWTPSLTRDESMRVALTAALASSAGPAAALSLVRGLIRHDVLEVLLGAIRQHDGGPLLRSCGWVSDDPSVATRIVGRHAYRPPDAPSAMLEDLAAAWFVTWGREDVRSLWLACALYAVERPALTFQPQLLRARAAAWIAATTSGGAVAATTSKESPIDRVPSGLLTAEPRRGSHQATAETGSRAAALFASTGRVNAGAASAAGRSTVKPAASTSGRERAVISRGAGEDVPPAGHQPEGLATGRAGLFYLVPAMRRLGMAAWLDSHADLISLDIPRQVLGRVARRLDVRDDDPVLLALGNIESGSSLEVNHAVEEWVRRLRRFCRLTAGMGLHSVVCRPGLVAFTDTHVDVLFDLSLADIRVRRAGLDIDPGWVDWLARVVVFHYASPAGTDA